ncbi:MAG: winged helix-turn-helix domain-containing protein, partial [Chloroflexota bacterium]|nr:winged helix-turn-helix domain-containing protein [Chloroflexota bacterium]
MAENMVDERSEEDCALALALLRRAERHASAGRPDSVRAILAEVWSLMESGDAEVLGRVAWQSGWILFGLGIYDEAGAWFARVGALPVSAGRTWPAARAALLDLCRALPNNSVALVGGPQVPAFRGEALDTWHASSLLPSLYVRTLGRFHVMRAGRVLPPCPSRKAGALLRYLLTRPHRTARREELTDLLWPDAPVREGTHSLHVAVSTLRRYLDTTTGSYINLEGGRYSITPDALISDDCGEFRRLA